MQKRSPSFFDSPLKRRLVKGTALIAVAGVVFALVYFRVFDFLTFENLKSHQAALQARFETSPFETAALFFLIYVVYVALSLPGSMILSLGAGAIFGTVLGSTLVSFSSSIGALLAFWFARLVFQDFIQRNWGKKLKPINETFRKEGISYLFTLRLIPLVPFFLINLAMGLTPLPARTYFWVSQLGMLPVTILYVNAGTALGQIASPDDILSWQFVLSLSLVGLFPLIIRLFQKRPQTAK